ALAPCGGPRSEEDTSRGPRTSEPPPAFLGRSSRRPALTQGRDPDLGHPAGKAKRAGGTTTVPKDRGASDQVPATRARVSATHCAGTTPTAPASGAPDGNAGPLNGLFDWAAGSQSRATGRWDRGRGPGRRLGGCCGGSGEQRRRRFLNSLGTIFSFISKDVVTKLQIMDQLRSGPQQEHYSSLQAMVAYEVGNQLVDLERRSRHPDSGCRTVLRLHRALRWLQLFLEGVRTSPEDTRTSVLCTDSYNASLATYHPWIIRRAVTVAFCALPTRKVFLESMNVGSSEQAVEMLDEALPFIERVYNISQKLYAEHALLDLP
uniref:Ceramide-1-phosphate transfer protein n=1 Tax=Moschus moschiferus TaxID=68415 RepID=A0A8C6DH80_MOSMO